jgi:hypothetical protein
MEEIEHISRSAAQIRLTDAERSAMRATLLAHIRANPNPSPYAPVASPFIFSLFGRGAFALAVMVIVGGGTAFASEGALPGDTLYPFKIGFVEPIAGAFQVGDEAQAVWHVELASRRLAEIDDLAEGDTLTPQAQTEAASRVAKSAQTAAADIDTLASKDKKSAGRTARKFEQTLARHGSTLRALGALGDASSTPVLQAAADVVEASAQAEIRAKAAQPFAASAMTMSVTADTSESHDESYQEATKIFKRTLDIANQDQAGE